MRNADQRKIPERRSPMLPVWALACVGLFTYCGGTMVGGPSNIDAGGAGTAIGGSSQSGHSGGGGIGGSSPGYPASGGGGYGGIWSDSQNPAGIITLCINAQGEESIGPCPDAGGGSPAQAGEAGMAGEVGAFANGGAP